VAETGRRWRFLSGLLLTILSHSANSAAAPPRVINASYRLELVASEPDIVTPIGLAFDNKGRLLVVESHTHQRPKDYQGPAGDRIRMFVDSDGDGRLDHWTTFAEGFHNAMNVCVKSCSWDGPFEVFVVARSEVLMPRAQWRKRTGRGGSEGEVAREDDIADDVRSVLKLDTKDDYPHDGLESIALTSGANGSLLVGMGENHGMAFRLVGSDDSEVKGAGEGGAIFRCTPEGGRLERWATGFWNPFSICVVGDHIFAVDNDPDACPPCRLLDIVPGGDYGFRYRYGRSGLHPLQSWNGELPGTLPMICGVDEAPTALVSHNGKLWVTSWGDHRIDCYTLKPRGATFSAEREVVVQGDDDFRPTGMAVAPDGSLYFGDWIRRDYAVHGHGKIWHLTSAEDRPPSAEYLGSHLPSEPRDATMSFEVHKPRAALESEDPFVHTRGAWAYSKRDDLEKLLAEPQDSARTRLGLLEAIRIKGSDQADKILRTAISDESPDVRLFAIRWIADDHLTALHDQVAKLLDTPPPSTRYYLAVLAAVDWLEHEPRLPTAGITDGLLVRELKNESRPPATKALALSLLSPDDKFLTDEKLREYLQSNFQPLRLEAVRALAQQTNPDRFSMLGEVARNSGQSDAIRAEAITGLAGAADQYRDLLEQFAGDTKSEVLQREAARALRLAHLAPAPVEDKPAATDLAAWKKLLESPGDAAAGRRLFFSSIGARCNACHQVGARGGRVGPDLTLLGRTSSRERIIASILQPSQEIAPEFQSWLLITKDGKTLSGLRLQKPGDDGVEDYADPAGKKFSLPTESIETREASTTSIMPDGLEKVISIDDLRDLVTFLTSPADTNK
jgi:putative membrane-bound dehydrogenase-like protein